LVDDEVDNGAGEPRSRAVAALLEQAAGFARAGALAEVEALILAAQSLLKSSTAGIASVLKLAGRGRRVR
jgi:hypothetical protein